MDFGSPTSLIIVIVGQCMCAGKRPWFRKRGTRRRRLACYNARPPLARLQVASIALVVQKRQAVSDVEVILQKFSTFHESVPHPRNRFQGNSDDGLRGSYDCSHQSHNSKWVDIVTARRKAKAASRRQQATCLSRITGQEMETASLSSTRATGQWASVRLNS